jgi:hypothetical protein
VVLARELGARDRFLTSIVINYLLLAGSALKESVQFDTETSREQVMSDNARPRAAGAQRTGRPSPFNAIRVVRKTIQ